MKRSLLLVPFLLSACAISMGPPTTKAEALPVGLFDGTGTRVGTATLNSDSTGMDVRLELQGMTPGRHTVQLHEHGLCERPDFLSAGTVMSDLKEVTVGVTGRGVAILRYQQGAGRFVPKTLFGGDGTAIIIGDSTGTIRLACGIMI